MQKTATYTDIFKDEGLFEMEMENENNNNTEKLPLNFSEKLK